jgi:hypothetical protein
MELDIRFKKQEDHARGELFLDLNSPERRKLF